jgi:hypothetical protein
MLPKVSPELPDQVGSSELHPALKEEMPPLPRKLLIRYSGLTMLIVFDYLKLLQLLRLLRLLWHQYSLHSGL